MSSQQRYRHDDYKRDVEAERFRDERRRSRSRSKHRHRRDSRSISVERHRRRHRSPSRSRSRSRSRSDSRGRGYSGRRTRHYSSRSSKGSNYYDKGRSRSNTPERKEKRHDRSSNEKVHHSYHFESNKQKDIPPRLSASNADVQQFHNLPLPQRDSVSDYYKLDDEEPIDKERERIHKEMEEKLRAALAKEGKVYPPPKPEASHPVFANDGSFLEIFKKMQEAQNQQQMPTATPTVPVPVIAASSTSTAAYVAATATGKTAPPPPIVGRRRGGKILKTGLVAKPKAQAETGADPKDFWSLYLAEVNKYKTHACETDTGNRPLVK